MFFGVGWGSVYVSIASTLGASGAFLIGRCVARETVSRKMECHAKFKAIDEAVAEEGWKIVGLVRLSPVFPFNLLNYALGLNRARQPVTFRRLPVLRDVGEIQPQGGVYVHDVLDGKL